MASSPFSATPSSSLPGHRVADDGRLVGNDSSSKSWWSQDPRNAPTSVPIAAAPIATRSLSGCWRGIRCSSKIASICAALSAVRIASGDADGGAAEPAASSCSAFVDPVGIDQCDWRAAMCTRAVGRQVDRRPALRARDLAHRRTELREFRGCRGADEVLLAQELIERDELPAVLVAAPIGETGRALQIVRHGER